LNYTRDNFLSCGMYYTTFFPHFKPGNKKNTFFFAVMSTKSRRELLRRKRILLRTAFYGGTGDAEDLRRHAIRDKNMLEILRQVRSSGRYSGRYLPPVVQRICTMFSGSRFRNAQKSDLSTISGPAKPAAADGSIFSFSVSRASC